MDPVRYVTAPLELCYVNTVISLERHAIRVSVLASLDVFGLLFLCFGHQHERCYFHSSPQTTTDSFPGRIPVGGIE